MDTKRNRYIFYILSFLFIGINLYLISIDIYYFSFLPVVLLFIAAALVKMDYIFFSIVFFTPLSVGLSEFIPGIAFNLYIPTEPLLIGLMFLFIFKLLQDGKLDPRFVKHPVTIAIGINLLWIFFTSITSTLPLVSFKFFFSRFWFVIGIYVLGVHLFQKYRNIEKFVWLYIIPMIIVIAYTIYRLSGYGLNDQKASNWVVWPFFSDHTSYGAMLVMFIFPLIGFAFFKKHTLLTKTLNWVLIFVFAFAIALSYTRAAWLSLFAAIGIWVIVKLKISFRTLLFTGLGIIVIAIAFNGVIFMKMEKNETESSGDFGEHIQSMANITSDASNLERINRWKCAIRMFNEKPFWGWGPGTYMFQYAPYQFSYDRTIISTDFGDLGNAHSEYLGPLAESGVLGTVTFIFMVVYILLTGFRIYNGSNNPEIRIIALSLTLGLCSYLIHGVLNNFLDTDKASVPFWGFTAMLVALDLYHKKQPFTEL